MKSINRKILALFIMGIFPLLGGSNEEELAKNFDRKIKTTVEKSQASREELGKLYRTSLERLLKDAMQKGSLDASVAIKEEMARWDREKSIPAELSETEVIKKSQLIYQKQDDLISARNGRKVVQIVRVYDQAMEDLEKELVSSSDLAGAKRVRTTRETIENSDLLKEAREAIKNVAPVEEKTTGKRVDPEVSKPVGLPKSEKELQAYLVGKFWTQNQAKKRYGFYEEGVFGDPDSRHRYTITGNDTLTIHWGGGKGGIKCKFSRDFTRLNELHGAKATFKLVEEN